MAGTFSYTKAAMERAMKVQEVILRAMARKITGGKRRWPGAGGTIGERVYASTQPGSGSDHQAATGPSFLQPVAETSIHLHQFPHMLFPFPPLAMPTPLPRPTP